jgi:hypothetical protein
VTIVGVTDTAANDTLSLAVPAGQPLSLILVVKYPIPNCKAGELRVLPFGTGESPIVSSTARIRAEGKECEYVAVGLDQCFISSARREPTY